MSSAQCVPGAPPPGSGSHVRAVLLYGEGACGLLYAWEGSQQAVARVTTAHVDGIDLIDQLIAQFRGWYLEGVEILLELSHRRRTYVRMAHTDDRATRREPHWTHVCTCV